MRRDTAYKRAIFEFFPEPLYLFQLDEFKWYCGTRRGLQQGRVTLTQTEAERYAKARRSFSSRRFYSAYRDWLTNSDPAFTSLWSRLLRDKLERGEVRVETQVLKHRYLNLGRVVSIA